MRKAVISKMTTLNNCSPHQFKNARIACKSQRSVGNFLNFIDSKLSDSIDTNLQQNVDVEKEQIVQNYKSTLVSNLQVNGQPVSLEDASTGTSADIEPFTTEKDEVLTTKMMNTTCLRKTAPLKIRSGIKKQIRHELIYRATVKMNIKEDTVAERLQMRPWDRIPGSVDTQTDDQGLDSETTQHCQKLLNQGKDLQKAVQFYQRSEGSEIQKVICDTTAVKQQPHWLHTNNIALQKLRI